MVQPVQLPAALRDGVHHAQSRDRPNHNLRLRGRGIWTPPLPVPLLGVGQSAWVDVTSNVVLAVVCPTNKTVACGTAWSFDEPVAASCCTNEFVTSTGVLTNLLVTPISTTTNGVCPMITVMQVWSIMDGCGDSTNCSQVVTVVGCCSNNCITVNCPSNITVGTCVDCVAVTYAATATDVCCGSNGSNVLLTYVPPSGSCFPIGTNQVTVYGTDSCSNIGSCNFDVIVYAESNFVINFPSNKSVQCGTTWSFDPPTAVTCCTNPLQTITGLLTNLLITATSTVTNGVCPLVTVTQTWSVVDGCGDSNNVSQVVTVTGCCTNCIALVCPSNIVLTTCSNCATAAYSATATNTCCFSNVVINYSPASGACFPLGTNTVQVTAHDPDCASTPPTTCSFTVTVLQSTNCSTNCCSNCVPPYPDSYTVTVHPGENFLGDDLCQDPTTRWPLCCPTFPTDRSCSTWNEATQSYNAAVSYTTGTGWSAPGTILSLGGGFILDNPTSSNYTITIFGCDPNCPLPCNPTNGYQLVSAEGTNGGTWSNLFSCPPECGTEVFIFNPLSQQYVVYTFSAGVWTPSVPVLAVGESAFVVGTTNPGQGMTVSCPTNKTVPCGTSWTFDTPTAATCCTNELQTSTGLLTNVLITPTTTVTNGACPLVTVTQTWYIVDGCGDSTNCSQVVTVTGCCTNPCPCNGSNGTPTVVYRNVYTFTNQLDGDTPSGGLIISGNTLYGTTAYGGTSNLGTLFSVQTDGSGFTVLHSFVGPPNDGETPALAPLILSGSTLYGALDGGGTFTSYGAIYSIQTTGSGFTLLHSFNGSDGANLPAGLVLSGTKLYGSTIGGGGAGNYGTLFDYNLSGPGFAHLYTFTGGNGGNTLYGGVTLSGSTLYGLTVNGGTSGAGTLYSYNAGTSAFTTLQGFVGATRGK